jgi:hypothetical protein
MEEELRRDKQLLVDFVREFASEMRFRLDPVDDEPDLQNPVRLRFVTPEENRLKVAAFAHEHGLDVETMLDKVSQVGMDNLFRPGKFFLVE